MLDTEQPPLRIVVFCADSLTTEYLQTILDHHRFAIFPADLTVAGIVDALKFSPDMFIVDDTDSTICLLDTCQTIRQYSVSPILVLSLSRTPGLAEKILDAGADDFLSKPVSGNLLIARLNTLARRTLAERDAARAIARGDKPGQQVLGLLNY